MHALEPVYCARDGDQGWGYPAQSFDDAGVLAKQIWTVPDRLMMRDPVTQLADVAEASSQDVTFTDVL